MSAGGGVRVRIGRAVVDGVAPGSRLLDTCEANDLPVEFGCRDGACGTCLVRIVAGAGNLSAPTPNEQILVPDLTDDARARLACQLVVHGPIELEQLDG